MAWRKGKRGRLPASAQASGMGPDRRLPDTVKLRRAGMLPPSPQAAGSAPVSRFARRCSCCSSGQAFVPPLDHLRGEAFGQARQPLHAGERSARTAPSVTLFAQGQAWQEPSVQQGALTRRAASR